MKLENSFTVPVPRADAWAVLLDVERIAPCLPGATLTARDGDSFSGTVKVKVGPINLTYGGSARFVSLDEEAGVAVLEGSGKETRGTGTAKARITCRLVDTGGSTRVDVETDLAVTGKPAQFGRGVLADVSTKLIDTFATRLSEEISPAAPGGPVPVTASTPGGAALAGGVASAAGASRAPRKAEPIDLVSAAGLPVLTRAAPAAGVLLLLALAYRLGARRGARWSAGSGPRCRLVHGVPVGAPASS